MKFIPAVVAIVAFVASVAVSREFCTGYWVVGPVFAAAVLMANYPRVMARLSWKHAVFVGASTLTYALVWGLADRGWKFQNDWLDGFFGALSAGVVLGSILLPAIHAYLFDVDLKTTRTASVQLILTWFAVVLISNLDEMLGFGRRVDYGLISILVWQGIYLLRVKIK